MNTARLDRLGFANKAPSSGYRLFEPLSYHEFHLNQVTLPVVALSGDRSTRTESSSQILQTCSVGDTVHSLEALVYM